MKRLKTISRKSAKETLAYSRSWAVTFVRNLQKVNDERMANLQADYNTETRLGNYDYKIINGDKVNFIKGQIISFYRTQKDLDDLVTSIEDKNNTIPGYNID